jgi:purine-binding chemotaxis protein CheW|tara:strand:- start:1870 stop:2307 length:438 start_codon:yes stop_codon:yes gene_type:complete
VGDFSIGEKIYVVNVMQVQEVLRYTDTAPVPRAPSCVRGIINLSGNVATVINTRQRFGLPAVEIFDQARRIIIEADNDVTGILVDTVAEVVYLNPSEIESAPNVGGNDSSRFIHGVCQKNNELLILVELNKLLTEQEWSETRESL